MCGVSVSVFFVLTMSIGYLCGGLSGVAMAGVISSVVYVALDR